MKIFITGGTGFLGRYALKGLLDSGHELFVLTRRESEYLRALRNPNLHVIHGDISQMERVVLHERFDGCIHFAWGGVDRNGVSDADVQTKNIGWSTDVLNFSISHGCRFFMNAGSRQEYAPTNEKITEKSLCEPISEYGKAKLDFYRKAVDICRANGVVLIHFRIFSVYGFGDHPWSLINSTVCKLKRGERIELGLCEHKWSFLHIQDFVNAVLSILCDIDRLSDVEIFNIASEDVRVLKDFIHAIQAEIPSKSEICFGAFRQNAESNYSLIPDTSKYREFTGKREDVKFEDGIRELSSML